MPYLYGAADTKFVRKKTVIKRKTEVPTKFKQDKILAGRPYFDHNDVPLNFKSTPTTLVELCVNVIDKFPIPYVYDWGELQVLKWLTKYGYPQYRNTFRVNYINGRKLLLCDASALSTMNIKDFDHIRHLTRGIRYLYSLDLSKMLFEMFKMFRTRTGMNYDEIRRSDLWRAMQLIPEKPHSMQHWELLELWLRREPVRKYVVLIGLIPRFKLYKCDLSDMVLEDHEAQEPAMCTSCIPPCDCNWTERDVRLPWRISCIHLSLHPCLHPNLHPNQGSERSRIALNEASCICKPPCLPPCECRWPSRYYLTGTVLRCLQQNFPEKFSPIFDERIKADVRPSVVERWTRFSF